MKFIGVLLAVLAVEAALGAQCYLIAPRWNACLSFYLNITVLIL